MKVLLIGSGGREHALASALRKDSIVEELHCAPGNPGIGEIATLHSINVDNNDAVIELAKKLSVDLVVIGPEKPLVNGLADACFAANIPVFGPTQAAALLEDLQALAVEQGTFNDFKKRLYSIRERHAQKRSFIDRLRKVA